MMGRTRAGRRPTRGARPRGSGSDEMAVEVELAEVGVGRVRGRRAVAEGGCAARGEGAARIGSTSRAGRDAGAVARRRPRRRVANPTLATVGKDCLHPTRVPANGRVRPTAREQGRPRNARAEADDIGDGPRVGRRERGRAPRARAPPRSPRGASRDSTPFARNERCVATNAGGYGAARAVPLLIGRRVRWRDGDRAPADRSFLRALLLFQRSSWSRSPDASARAMSGVAALTGSAVARRYARALLLPPPRARRIARPFARTRRAPPRLVAGPTTG